MYNIPSCELKLDAYHRYTHSIIAPTWKNNTIGEIFHLNLSNPPLREKDVVNSLVVNPLYMRQEADNDKTNSRKMEVGW